MGAQQRMVASKGAVLSMLMDAYQKRDKVGLIAFKGAGAELLLPPTSSVEMAQKYLEELPTGGKTPLSHGKYVKKIYSFYIIDDWARVPGNWVYRN